jgi:peptide/nickel transport system ATP-binding protein
MSTPLLSVDRLSVSFLNEGIITLAVKEISFKVEPGEMLAIVGESGSGKSVTALALMRLLSKQSKVTGRIMFATNKNAAIDLEGLDERSIRDIRGKDIAMIFQEPMTSLNPVLTCGFQVSEAIQLHQHVSASIARQRTVELFEKVQLPNPAEIVNRYPHQLSGGQKQRVMIAMAMSCNPSLLIADEPTTALDVTVQKAILELIKQLQQQNGMSVILITHDLGLVADIAENVIVMYKGEIIEAGETKKLLQQPQHPYTKALIACRPVLHARGERLPVVGDTFKEDSLDITSLQPQQLAINVTSSKTVLEVEHLKVFYRHKKILFGKTPEPFKAVNDVSFSVSKGETLGLVGESGCGKTTLGRAILQLIPSTSGKIILDGIDLLQLQAKDIHPLRKNLQIVFQDPYGSLNPRLSIGNAILEPMKVHSILNNKSQRKDKVIELLEKVKLQPDHFDRYPHQFSGGQRQRICIARALALNPSFLIFDESVSALDVSVQAQVLNLLNDLKKEFEFTSIFISHDLSVVRYISDRIMVMNKGIIVEEGPADEIYFTPKHSYTQQLIAAIPGKSMSGLA